MESNHYTTFFNYTLSSISRIYHCIVTIALIVDVQIIVVNKSLFVVFLFVPDRFLSVILKEKKERKRYLFFALPTLLCRSTMQSKYQSPTQATDDNARRQNWANIFVANHFLSPFFKRCKKIDLKGRDLIEMGKIFYTSSFRTFSPLDTLLHLLSRPEGPCSLSKDIGNDDTSSIPCLCSFVVLFLQNYRFWRRSLTSCSELFDVRLPITSSNRPPKTL